MSFGAPRLPRPACRRSKTCDSTGRSSRGSATKDFEELFACLKGRNVKALVVGGYAVAFHGRPRFTKDEAWAHRVPGKFGTATVDYIGLDDLVRNKRTSARPQDLLDVEDLSADR